MTAERKNKLKKAALSWLCVATMASGSIPGSFSGIIPAMTVAAEDQQTYVSEIDLQQIVNYRNGTTDTPEGVSISDARNGYTLRIDQSGTYKLKGSNYINSSYVDVKIQCNSDVNATIICDDVYIKNDDGYCFGSSGGSGAFHNFYSIPFDAGQGTMKISGNVAVETYFCQTDKYSADLTSGNVTGSFFTVTYKDADRNTLGRTHYLSGGTYQDRSGIPADYPCVSSNGAVFDYNNITAAADVICSDHTLNDSGICNGCGTNCLIELPKLSDYLNGTAALPDGISIKNPENFDDIVEMTISKSGTYKLSGTNKIGDAYYDLKIIIDNNAVVTLDCKDAYIKNDNKAYLVKNSPQNNPTFTGDWTKDNVYSYNADMDYSGGYTAFNYVTPFVVKSGSKLTINGKLFIDTATAKDSNSTYYLPSIECEGEAYASMRYVYYIDADNDNETFDQNYFHYGEEYTATDYVDSKYHCIKVEYNDPGDYKFDNDPSIYLAEHHSVPDDDDTCAKCGRTFAMRTVTIYDGSETPIIKRVAENDTIDKPADPTAPIGKKFTGWYTDEDGTDPFDFTQPITGDITIYPGWGDLPVEGISVTTQPTKTTYKEGDTFDPTGLKIKVSYENGDIEVEYNDNTKDDFTFSPSLDTELSPTDTKITITYGGQTEEQDITVAAKVLESISISAESTATTRYIEGTAFDPTGLVITLHYDNDTTVDVAYGDATKSSFTVPTANLALGDSSVTIEYLTKQVILPVTVVKKSLASIAVEAAPTKTEYIEGEIFDPSGLKIKLNYDNETSGTVEYNENTKPQFGFDAPAPLTTTCSAVTISYTADNVTKTTTQNIVVAEKSLKSIAVKTPATKTEYTEGDAFDATGLVLTLTYDNGTTKEVAYGEDTKAYFTFAPAALSVDDSAVTISYGGKTATQAVTVAAKQITSVAIKTAPTKTAYLEGQVFNPAGLVLTLTYNNGKTENVAYGEATKADFTFGKTGALAASDSSITITYGGKTVAQAITVAAKQLTSVAIKTAPTKTAYLEGQVFNPAGLVLTLTYNNGKTENVAYGEATKADFTFSKTGALAASDSSVAITYGGKTVAQAITVAVNSLKSISVKTAPTKTVYVEGELFDPTGLVLALTYDNGISTDVTYSEATKADFTFGKTGALAVSDNSITITYGGKTVAQAITVAAKQLTSVAIKTAPTKTAYKVGEMFDPTGLVLTLTYNNGTTEDVAYGEATKADFTFSKTSALAVSDNSITITYGGKTVAQAITVAAKQLTSVAIKTAPTKTAYKVGEMFDPTGLVLTLTYNNGTTEDVAYGEATKADFTFSKTGALAVSDTSITIVYNGKSVEQGITVTKSSSGGSSGTIPGGSSKPSTAKPVNKLIVDGKELDWNAIIDLIKKSGKNSNLTIGLNGNTEVPFDVIKAIDDVDCKVKFVVDQTRSWIVDGEKIKTPGTADLTLIKTAHLKPVGLRGEQGIQFSISGTNVSADLEFKFDPKYAGMFANLYKVTDSGMQFVDTGIIDAEGRVSFPNVTEKGNYIVMISELSDRPGDMNNDGTLNALDSSAILKDVVGIEAGNNPEKSDYNGDGMTNALDASAILKAIVGLK